MNGEQIDIGAQDIDTSKETLLYLREELHYIKSKQTRLALNLVVDIAYHAICAMQGNVDTLAHKENIKADMKILNCMRHVKSYRDKIHD